MTKQDILALLEQTPIIAAIKDNTGLAECLRCDAPVVFVLYGTVVSIPDIVRQAHTAGKAVFVHIDLIDGLSAREAAVDYIASATAADGIISTKPALVRRAQEIGLVAIRRFFLLDSLALHNLQKQLAPDVGDLVEILPGVMPKMLQKIADASPVPLVAGGLVSDKEDVLHALSAGAIAVSSTNPAVWYL